ncbi:L,D-transpeptidase family protein [Sphingomonas sp. GCM10030256]|uniref:L,D-transpeptidase family protein n=1 Tax=Sphingomonas sp. GCM10030256 TaxID=3273427 RepID=UPI00361151DA
MTFVKLVLLASLAAQPALARAQPVPSAAALPPGGQRGLDMIMVDAEGMPQEPELARDMPETPDEQWSGAPVDLLRPINPLYTELRRGLVRYQIKWSSLPQVAIPAGAPLKAGASGERAELLRKRLGLGAADPLSPAPFDGGLEQRLREYQQAHGLPVDGVAGSGTIRSLNRGAGYYERLIVLNMERARRLPAPGTARRYILVDAGAARLWMMEDGRPVGSMKVVVGKAASRTPMMAALMRYVNVNPYWNIPPDLVQALIAPKVLAEGPTYLSDRRYQVLDSWEEDARVMDPSEVDWQAVAAGRLELRVRQLPGGTNSMGEIKFMMPNEYGIYLHDTPNRAPFEQDNRFISNGCVRLEDARALARWIFGDIPRAQSPDAEQRVDLPEPLPVYLTYLTVGVENGAIAFRADPYERDAPLLAKMIEQGSGAKESALR